MRKLSAMMVMLPVTRAELVEIFKGNLVPDKENLLVMIIPAAIYSSTTKL
jgi:hypothetical protein